MTTYQQARQLGALGDPTRRAIFERLGAGPLAVSALADVVPVSRPAVSQHLKVLKEAGLIVDRAEGTRRIYQHDPSGLAALRAYLDQFWTGALDAFRIAAEETHAGKRSPKNRKAKRTKRKEKPR